jgi:hypothetical protein
MRSLDSTEYREAWDSFYETFKFKPSMDGSVWHVFASPVPL